MSLALTNADHIRASPDITKRTGVQVAGPMAEKSSFGMTCDRWLSDGEKVVPGQKVLELQGSKTPGELALLLNDIILITGDLIRAYQAN